MTTSKPDGAGPTEEDFKKASHLTAELCRSYSPYFEKKIAQALASERAEAEKKIEDLEMCIASWKKEELIWKDLELRYQAARNVAIKYRTIWGELAEPVVKYSEMHIFVDKEIEAELSD